jgi:hypothetical protein
MVPQITLCKNSLAFCVIAGYVARVRCPNYLLYAAITQKANEFLHKVIWGTIWGTDLGHRLGHTSRVHPARFGSRKPLIWVTRANDLGHTLLLPPAAACCRLLPPAAACCHL